jgi:apolipoprotein N-acyltransferase
MSAVVALAVLRRPRAHLAWILLVLPVAALPKLPDAERGKETALLVQPNLNEEEEWTAASVDHMQQNLAALTVRSALSSPDRPPSLAIWPEVPAPLYYDKDERFRDYMTSLARRIRAYLLIGVVAHTRSNAPLNSALLISPDGVPLSRYDKVHLVPFGEFVPWPFSGFAESISTEVGNFAAGDRVVVAPVGDQRIGTFICYESVFPNFVRKFAVGGAGVLINISNDGWFGKSAAREQHLSIVRMRAAENRRWILRSTNNGITATIDSAGRLRGTLPQFVEAAWKPRR